MPESEQTGDGPEKKITRLAIGVEGGFDPACGKPKFTYTDHYNVVVLPGFHMFPWPNPALPEVVSAVNKLNKYWWTIHSAPCSPKLSLFYRNHITNTNLFLKKLLKI